MRWRAGDQVVDAAEDGGGDQEEGEGGAAADGGRVGRVTTVHGCPQEDRISPLTLGLSVLVLLENIIPFAGPAGRTIR
ncbi:hypothetical protein Aoc01nite_76320 [Actinoplanes octamycinicus]|nr:hypothetical protein Aoc01nite_76320 [Actinoplanes octamycinicus]